jgi:hypothetical protein
MPDFWFLKEDEAELDKMLEKHPEMGLLTHGHIEEVDAGFSAEKSRNPRKNKGFRKI